jgi:hypothetical protein
MVVAPRDAFTVEDDFASATVPGVHGTPRIAEGELRVRAVHAKASLPLSSRCKWSVETCAAAEKDPRRPAVVVDDLEPGDLRMFVPP